MGTKVSGYSTATLAHAAALLERRAAKYLADALEGDAIDRDSEDDRKIARQLEAQATRLRAKVRKLTEIESLM